ncbi:hypothetical protein [Streptomyces rimosus]|uniref:hypothetical protein n=1 Tax=Streptomyces rimosus TaxID=1927 RepID=UPI0004C852D4|nr:hypothetical protein [Streptomyces rimosus]
MSVEVVRALKILASGTVAVSELADAGPETAAAPAGPVRTRETAWDGYRRALAARREVALPRQVGPDPVWALSWSVTAGWRSTP